MAANYGKLDTLQRELVYELKSADASGREVVEALAAGRPDQVPPIAAVRVTVQAVNDLYRRMRRDREELHSVRVSGLVGDQGVDLLTRRLVLIADREADRLTDLQAKRGQLTPKQLQQLGALASAVSRIDKLARTRAAASAALEPPKAPGPDETERVPSLAERLISDAGSPAPPVAAVPNGDAA